MAIASRPPTAAQPILFAPNWERDDWRLWELVSATGAGMLCETAERMLEDVADSDDPVHVKVAFSLSLLLDLLKAGANAWTRDSRLYVQWPDWNSSEGRGFAQAAMNAAKDLRPLTQKELARVSPLFARDLEGHELASVLGEAEFRLVPATAIHPTGASYQDAFNAALRYWSMPYRGRSGRMKRFVVTATHKLLGPHPIVAGILELGDEAPFCQWRDDLLGLNLASFVRWINGVDRNSVQRIADRFRDIRRHLRSTSDGCNLSKISAANLVKRASELEASSQGRSTVRDDQRELLKDRKRIAYGLRLAKGEAAIRSYIQTGDITLHTKWLYDGVRGIHDLLIPRVHLEATVCGAVPPFATGLGGKLVVAFLSHPFVLSATQGSESELLNWSFKYKSLAQELPSVGMLCITTKGLYANHAAIYTRSEMPGEVGPLRFRHLANTDGTTTTLIGERTVRFAKQALIKPEGSPSRVSTLYGSGGAKRHRFIEAATISVGLPARTGSAGIQRPVYGTLFVSNAPAVCWLNDSPSWLVARDMSAESFSDAAASLWRRKWLARAVDRVADYALIPSLPSFIRTAD
jgi:hypothetical protein